MWILLILETAVELVMGWGREIRRLNGWDSGSSLCGLYSSFKITRTGYGCTCLILALGRLRQKNHEFKPSLSNLLVNYSNTSLKKILLPLVRIDTESPEVLAACLFIDSYCLRIAVSVGDRIGPCPPNTQTSDVMKVVIVIYYGNFTDITSNTFIITVEKVQLSVHLKSL